MLAIAAGLVLALPALAAGFFADDDALLAYLTKRASYSPPWYDLYHFTPDSAAALADGVAHGQFAWWTAPGLRLHLVRPLSSALLAMDHALFGQAALGYHVHSLIWWALLLVGVRLVTRRALPAATGALALFLYATADAHAAAYGWISARHSLVAGAPAVFALAAAMRAREERWSPGRWLAPLAMIVALLGGEVALGGLAFWASYEALGPSRPERWGARLGRAAVPIAIGLAYLGVYALIGGGVRQSGAYVEPSDAGAFVAVAAKRFPALLAAAFVEFPSELAAALPAAPFVVVGGLAVAGVTLLWRAIAPLVEESERVAIRWMGPGAVLAMLGAVGGFPGGRLLLLANLAWSALLAVLLRHGFRVGPPLLFPRRAATALLACLHGVASPLLAVGTTLNLRHVAHAVAEIAHSPALVDGPATRTFFVQASDPMTYLYVGALRLREGSLDPHACGTLFSGSPHGARVTRSGPASLVVEPLSGALLEGPFEVLYRAPSIPLAVGYEAQACGASIVVLAVDTSGRPTKIEARLDVPLDDPSVRLVAWKDGALSRVTLQVGETELFPWSPGPLQMF